MLLQAVVGIDGLEKVVNLVGFFRGDFLTPKRWAFFFWLVVSWGF